MRCPACGFWKVNEFYGGTKCKKCGYENKPKKQLEDERCKKIN